MLDDPPEISRNRTADSEPSASTRTPTRRTKSYRRRKEENAQRQRPEPVRYNNEEFEQRQRTGKVRRSRYAPKKSNVQVC